LKSLSPVISSISAKTEELLFYALNTEPGFINKIFKYHPSLTFIEVMHHVCFIQQIEGHQHEDDWIIKLLYADIYKNDESINYVFRHLIVNEKKANQK
jgi:hypothetical protein